MRRLVLVGCLIVLWATSGVWAQISVKSTDHLVYDNGPYGYIVKLPRDLTYTRASPPSPNHGVSIDLRSGAKLWVDASYTDASSNEDESAIVTTGCRVHEKHTASLGGQAALSLRFTCPASEDRRAYTELIILAVHRQGDRSSADYQIGLRVYGSEIPADEKVLFTKVVDGFRFEK